MPPVAAEVMEVRCESCKKTWEEELKAGMRPWRCPKCDPASAARRNKERERKMVRDAAARQERLDELLLSIPLGRVPLIVDLSLEMDNTQQPDDWRRALGTRVTGVAQAGGTTALRTALLRLAAMTMRWAERL